MSWIRNTSFSLARHLSHTLNPRSDYEPHACYNSFCKHWQQAHDIITKSQPQHLHDDVLGVVNHLEQLATLLVLEARAREINSNITNGISESCLEYLLSENLLDKLYEWAACTGKYENAVRLEQLKLFRILISHYNSQVIAAEPFLRPLLKLLSSFRNELPPLDVESQLVTVLNQLCVTLMQNMRFIDLFFLTTHAQNGSMSEFIIIRLLLSSVHREGGVGSAARDALLLCAKMTASCEPLAQYMLKGTNACPVLATGLSGLYSYLPRTLDEKIHRLSSDDVNRVNKLTLFIDCLEFCNAVAQVAHSSIKRHLLDLLFQGFLLPVMGPALLQSGAPERAAATAYLELCLRCTTRDGLLSTILKFMLRCDYDGARIIDVVLSRLDGTTQLSLVSLTLVETLIDLNCEDVMLELVYKYLLNGHHLMVSHRHRILDPEPYREAAIAFLSLSPRCCLRPIANTRAWVEDLDQNSRRVLDLKREEGRRSNGISHSIAMSNLVQENSYNYGNPNETLFGNYHAYLCDAHYEIASRTLACTRWSSKYDSTVQMKRETNNNSPAKDIVKEQDSIISASCSTKEDKEPHSLNSFSEEKGQSEIHNSDSSGKDSLTSIGESSGYDSFRYNNEDGDMFAEDSFWKYANKVQVNVEHYEEMPLVRSWKASAESIIGPLLSSLLKKCSLLLESDLTQNTRVTGIIAKLMSFPTPLLTSLLCPGFVLQPNVTSLFQLLQKIREDVDELTSGLENSNDLVDKARLYLIQKELYIVKARAPNSEDSHQEVPIKKPEDSPFRRNESKRMSISSSISSMFGRRLSSSSIASHSLSLQTAPTTSISFTQDEFWDQSIGVRSILNAVILDEWVKELASLCEEHALRLSTDVCDELYLRTLAL